MTNAVSHLPEYLTDNIMDDAQFEATRNWLDANGSRQIRQAADALKLLEEVIELCYVSGAYVAEVDQVVISETHKALNRNECSGHYDEVKVEEEVGDVSICLAAFIQKAPINSNAASTAALAKIRDRKWALDEFGVLRRPDRNPFPYKE